jgi:hypothetical protein
MYAEVNSARSIRSPLVYNEQKVETNQADLLDARNFWQEKEDLSLHDKQQRFSQLTVLNERSVKKILHASVNFHPDDKLSDKQMTAIAKDFMKGIGFGDQPWLVYRHKDAGHPHMHIVSTNIRPDGSRISNDLRAPHHLMKLCSGIERKHGLRPVMAPTGQIYLSRRDYVPSLKYGEMPTRTGIQMVIGYVLENYRFTSFESYNAILSLYNVRADRGNPDGIMYHNRGLYYRMIDEKGKKLGAPIKASDFYMPVTLDALEEKYRLNRTLVRETDRDYMRVHIDYNLINVHNLGKFRQEMARHHRTSVIIPAFKQRPTRHTAPTDRPGMFFLDFNTMTIFRDTELGKDYTAESILRRCGLDKSIPELARQQQLGLKPGEQALLDNPDLNHAPTRDLLLRLSRQHDAAVEKQQELELTQRHRLRHSL